MDITKSNFKEKLPEILSSISEASFISCDGEFTGISYGKGIHAFDTTEERYLKLKEGASNFLMIQFGLCTFHYDSDQKKYTHRAFNFYIFPRPFKRGAPDVRFLCQVSSLDFLANQGFDFNKLINEGISYLTPVDEEKLRTEIEQKHESYRRKQSPNSSLNDTPQIPIPPEYEDFLDGICTRIDLLLESSDETTIDLPPANRFLRKLIYQTTKKYCGKIHLETKSSDKDGRISVLSATKISNSEELKDLEDAKLKEDLDELDDAAGFSKIIRYISQSKKLFVGHNMLLDLLLTINQFRCPLPENYEDFKVLAQCIFPLMLDTKLMASMHPFKELVFGTALENLQKQLTAKPFIQPSIESSTDFVGYSTESLRLHEAGYDAFVTGVCFVTMCKYLGSLQKPPLDTVLPDSPLLEPYLNKLFLLRVQDIPYMNLGGKDTEVNRDHVFHLTFPKEWTNTDLHQLFSSYGAVYVAWIDDVSAFVALRHNLDQSSNVIKTLGHSNVYKILTYKEHRIRKGLDNEIAMKPVPASDVNLASLRRKRKSTSENNPKRNIDPIPEEDEPEEQPVEKKKRNEDDAINHINKSASNFESTPNKKRSNSKSNDMVNRKKNGTKKHSPKKGKKLFAETESWDD